MSIYIFIYEGDVLLPLYFDILNDNIRVGLVIWGYNLRNTVLFLIPITFAQLSYCSFRKPKKEKIYQAIHSLTRCFIILKRV